jgi:putative RNA 2'-phosphotransferase
VAGAVAANAVTTRALRRYRASVQLPKNLVALSKRLSYVLRHRPDSIGVALTSDGWVPIETLLRALSAHGARVTREQLDAVVAGNNKQRFAVDGERIRASQGHSGVGGAWPAPGPAA